MGTLGGSRLTRYNSSILEKCTHSTVTLAKLPCVSLLQSPYVLMKTDKHCLPLLEKALAVPMSSQDLRLVPCYVLIHCGLWYLCLDVHIQSLGYHGWCHGRLVDNHKLYMYSWIMREQEIMNNELICIHTQYEKRHYLSKNSCEMIYINKNMF